MTESERQLQEMALSIQAARQQGGRHGTTGSGRYDSQSRR